MGQAASEAVAAAKDTPQNPMRARRCPLLRGPTGYGVYQIGDVYARSVIVIRVPGSGFVP
jgi:hypothetical protein